MAADKSRPPLFRRRELGHRAGFFAADLRRLWQVKCGNQFALPPGLLSRILMNLSLSSTHTHTHSNTHFNAFLVLLEMRKQPGWSVLASRLCVCLWTQITPLYHSTLRNSYRGNKVRVKPGVQQGLHNPFEPKIYKTRTTSAPVRLRLGYWGGHICKENTFAVTRINTNKDLSLQ